MGTPLIPRGVCMSKKIILGVMAFLFVANAPAVFSQNRAITGYYYDPSRGNLLPKYDNLTPREVNNYLWEQANAAAVAQIRGLTTWAQIRVLTPSDVQFLTAAQLRNIVGANLRNFSAAQLAVLTRSQMSALTDAQIAGLSAAQRNALTQEQVEGVNTAVVRISLLPAAQREWLTQQQVQLIMVTGQFQYLPVSKVQYVGLANIRYLTAAQIPGVTGPQISALTYAQYTQIGAAQRQALNSAQVQAISASNLASWTNAVYTNLTATQRAYMTDQQTQALPLNQVRIQNIPVANREYLTSTQITQIGNYNATYYPAVPNSKVQYFSTTQISSLTTVARFNTTFPAGQDAARLQTLTQSQVMAIPAAYYNTIKSRLSPAQRAWRP